LSRQHRKFHSAFRFPAGDEDFGAHIAAGLSPFIVLLGQDRADPAVVNYIAKYATKTLTAPRLPS
jgi:hypothetical protein